MASSGPIGVFDSGVGGLSVLKEIRQVLPREDFIYFADSAFCPYGGKQPEFIRQRSIAIGNFLVGKGAKAVVVASNTTSASGLEALRTELKVPIIGVEPAVKPAAALTKTGKVGVLATVVTLASARFSSLVSRFCDGVEVVTQPCPGLVELVEDGELEKAGPLLERYLLPLLEQGATTIVLGCTHYPFLRAQVEKMAGAGVRVIDSGDAVARQTVKVLEQEKLLNTEKISGSEMFFTSGDAEKVSRVVSILWSQPDLWVESVKL